ncbi:Integral membrane protein (PIN domain superfamily) [Legionella steigerwaltii]|uniref:23, 7 kDa protein n=2 Tax=Legionella steigerwaltii TaxID=460 RepID=A0A378LAR4_9GAMM|nr:23, 7 kDa protein [Legionella steigerwaltii]STY23002.1 Integral membrane protein (PIN domain superfamily) [Legionella steigerwaltii]
MYFKSFFPKKYTHESVLVEIKRVKDFLKDKEETDKSAFFILLQYRIEDFERALKETPDPYEKQRIIDQYHRFAKTVLSCLSKPKDTDSYISTYFDAKNYYPVGVTEVIQEPIRHNISLAATILGAALILASIAAIWINPLITAILLPIGITILAPGGTSLLISSPLDPSAKQTEEKQIFEAGARVIDPKFDADQKYYPQLTAVTL